MSLHAFDFQPHVISKTILAEYKKIARACPGQCEAWLLYQGNNQDLLCNDKEILLSQCMFEEINALGFPLQGLSVFPSHSHFPLAHFYAKHHEYTLYWLIEYDVRFSGNWKTLFNAFENVKADLIAADFARYSEEPKWPPWELSHPRLAIPLGQRWRCFQPIYRISNPALAFICAAHRDGWAGHSEVVFPTLLSANGFSLVDFGGKGHFVLPGMENKFYTGRQPNPEGLLDKGTLRWRPAHARTGFCRNKFFTQ